MAVNNHLILVSGMSGTGKSVSLMDLENPEGVVYLNCEAGKSLPFPSKFQEYVITDPMDIIDAIEAAEEEEDIHTVVIDSLTFMMEMYESVYVIGSANTMAAWGEYQQYFKNLMQQTVASSSKNIIFTAHTQTILNESEAVLETKIPVKGALKNNSIEAYFSLNVAAKKITIKDLKKFDNDLLTITEEEEEVGYKHVFQTRITKKTTGEKIRAPMRMFSIKETYIDNNVQLILNRLDEYYGK